MTASSGFVGAIDQGTTGTRFVVFDADGTPVGDGFVAHERSLSPPDRVEYDPEEIWQCTRAAFQEGIDRAGIDHDELTAIGLATQRQTTVVWDESGTPVAPAQSWQDRRTERLVSALDEETSRAIEDRTGLIVDPYFAGTKLAWLLENETYRGRPLRKAAESGEVSFGTIDSWLLSKLTGRHATDVTNAGQSLLFDQRELAWDDWILDSLDIPKAMLPDVSASADPEAFGRTDVGGLLDAEVPVTGVIGNQQAALVGQAGFDVGATKVSYGSGNFALQHVGEAPVESDPALLSTIWFQRRDEPPKYGLEGVVLSTGTVLEWLEGIGIVPEHGRLVDEGDPLSAAQPVVVPTIGGGGSFRWRGVAGGTITGLTRFTSRDDIVRATIDGIGFATRSVLDRIEEAGGREASSVFVDGGAITDDVFAERQATLLGRRLIRRGVAQTSALGACFTAGLAAGLWDTSADFPEICAGEREFLPQDSEATEDRFAEWIAVAEGSPLDGIDDG